MTNSGMESQILNPRDEELLKEASDAFARLQAEVGKVIIGQQEAVTPLLAAIFAQGHVLLIGVPGLAKTLLVRTLGQALGWNFRRIQFTPDMMPADIIGMELLEDDRAAGTRRMRFVPGPVFANLILADEINRTPPKTQSALLEAMQERTVTSMGETRRLEPPFVVIATQNPIEQEGTYPLPEAQLDRFMFSLWMDYPSVGEEEDIVAATTSELEPRVEQVFSREKMIELQRLVRRVPVSRHVVSYAVAIARATRPHTGASSNWTTRYVEWGAGPRASQNLILAGKALAVLEGKPAVSAAHVRRAAPWVLRHRVLPNYTASSEGMTSAQIIKSVLDEIREPQYA